MRPNRPKSASAPKSRAWLEANWNPDLGLVEWRNKLFDSGWGAPHWPKEWYGRDLPVTFNAVVDEEFAQDRRGRRRQGRHPHARGGDDPGARHRPP